MAFSLRGRTAAYDNIAVGSVTGRERTILNQAPTTELIGGGTGGTSDAPGVGSLGYSNITVANTYHTSPASGAGGIQDRLLDSTGATAATLAGERLG